MSKLKRRVRYACALLAILVLYNSCVRITPPANVANMTITINGIFNSCHNPTSSSAPIPFKGTVQVYNFNENGTSSVAGDFQTFTSGANPATPVTVTVKVPVKNYYRFDIIAQGTA